MPLSALRSYTFLLWILAAVGGLGINGVFVYAVIAQPETIWTALQNPVAAAFIGEAVVMTGLLAWLLPHLDDRLMRWRGFVALSLLGGLVFSVPVAVLWALRTRRSPSSEPSSES